MENFIGWLLLAALIAIPCYLVIRVVRRYQTDQQAYKDNLERYEVEIRALKAREQERWRQQSLRPSLTDVSRYTKPGLVSGGGGGGSSRNYTNTATPLDSTLSDVATMWLLNSALQHGSAHATVDHDTGSIQVSAPATDSSFESSREEQKAASDTFSSSSWSSDSSSSSSDSGPSSDW